MELTLDEALQKAIEVHKAGQVQEAERLYSFVLNAQPNHPDANHNLGLIAVSDNKADVALPLFKTALKANPKIEQFWLSYIDVLISLNMGHEAKRQIQACKDVGHNSEKIDNLSIRLEPKNSKAKYSFHCRRFLSKNYK